MSSIPSTTVDTGDEAAEAAVRALHRRLLEAWNDRDAAAFAAPFAEDGYVVGFDGSEMDGREAIATEIGQIFAHHMTARYVGKVREVRFLTPDVAVLRAVAGLVPRGRDDLNPDANAIQTLVARKRGGQWAIALYQNTPAQFHGRPQLVESLTAELRALIGGQLEAVSRES